MGASFLALWMTLATAATAEEDMPLLYLAMDGSLHAALSGGAATPSRADLQIPFHPGVRGQCARVGSDLRWSTPGCFDCRAGTVAFWLRPQWAGTDKTPRVLFCIYGGRELKQPWAANRFTVSANQGRLTFWICGSQATQRVMLHGNIRDWQPDQWHHVAVTWSGVNSGRADADCRVYLDARLAAESHGVRLDVGPMSDILDIGRDSDQSPDYAHADYDEFYIYGRALSGEEIQRGVAMIRGAEQPAEAAPSGCWHPDWWSDAFSVRCRATIAPQESMNDRTVFRLPLDLEADIQALGIHGEVVPASLRVVPCDARTGQCPEDARPLPVLVQSGAILWQMPKKASQLPSAVQIYFDVAEVRPGVPLFAEKRCRAWPQSETPKLSIPDYATDTYGTAWDFNRDGDFAGIDVWGNRPEFIRNRQVKDGLLSFDVTEDGYFVWGELWSNHGKTKRPVAIDLKKYPILKMRVRQSCPAAEWDLYARGDSLEVMNYKFRVTGTGWQVIHIDLAKEARWGGVLKALRIDPTSRLANVHIEFDWIQLTNEISVEREAVEVRSRLQQQVASLAVEVERLRATCGSQQTASVRALDAGGRPIAGQPVTVRLETCRDGQLQSHRLQPTLALGQSARRGVTDRDGRIRVTLVDSRRADAKADTLAARADFQAARSASVSIATVPGPAHHYEIRPAHPKAIGESRFPLKIEVQLVDEYGNPLPVAGRRVKLTASNGASLEPNEVTTDAQGRAETTVRVDVQRQWVPCVEGADASGLPVRTATFSVALEKSRSEPIRLLANGYFASGPRRAFVPLGGFYANWVQMETPDGEWGVLKSFTDTTDEEKCRWMKFLHDNGTTAMRLMLRTHRKECMEPMDVGGRVNQALLADVMHYMDLARQFDLKFQVVLHQDYGETVYFNEHRLRRFALPAFADEKLGSLPPEQARFIRDRRLINPISAKYTDPDAMACQDRYVGELIPSLRHCPQVFAYELENEMVACPASWAKHAIETLRKLDPLRMVCVSHGGGGLITADPLWWHRSTPIDFYNYHLYPHDRTKLADIDYGTAIDVLTRYGRMSGPSLLGESAGDEFSVHPSAAVRKRIMRDIIWFALTNGNPGVFFWNARGSEVREFRLARQAMAQLDLASFRRATPSIGIDVRHPMDDDRWFRTPEGKKAYAMMGRYALHYLAAGVDFDFTVEPEKYERKCSLAQFSPPEPRQRLFEVPAGWQVSYLARPDCREILVYVRNFPGIETWNYKHAYSVVAIGLRSQQPAALPLRWNLPGKDYRVTVYDLESQTVESRDVRAAGLLDLGTTGHDFALILKRQ